MKIITAVTVFLITCFAFSSCKDMENANDAGKVYCECMHKNGSPTDYEYAKIICDAELIQKSKQYRIGRVDIRYEATEAKVSYETRIANAKFMTGFTDYIRHNCCDIVLTCTDTVAKSNSYR